MKDFGIYFKILNLAAAVSMLNLDNLANLIGAAGIVVWIVQFNIRGMLNEGVQLDYPRVSD